MNKSPSLFLLAATQEDDETNSEGTAPRVAAKALRWSGQRLPRRMA